MRKVYIVVVLLGVAAILVDHLIEPLERPRGVAGGFRRRLRALRRAVPIEEIIDSAVLLRKASTSARIGAPEAPPNFVHLSAAVALAKRMISGSARPSTSASVKPPWKASPAPERVDNLDLEGRQVA